MSLFPAYSQEGIGSSLRPGAAGEPVCRADRAAADEAVQAAESALLASSDSEPESPAPAPAAAEPEPDYYVDRRFDGGNLRVSTIYYPGRPQYNSPELHLALGVPRGTGAGAGRRKRARRYWEEAWAGGAAGCAAEGEGEGERGAALRRALVQRPGDEELWLQYVDYQEWVHGAAAGLAAAEAAAARLPRAGAGVLRARRHQLLQALPAHDYVTRLRDELAQEKDPLVSAELWTRLVGGLARTPAAGVAGAGAAAAAAAHASRRLPAAYPALLLAHGAVLRAAGLWETLVLLLELVLAAAPASASAAACFPPPRDPERERAAEERLQDYEDKVVNSGLPGGAVWARVERARAAAHWRPARAADAAADADPQRAPTLADVADLVLPCTDPAAMFLLLVNALRLAKVPLLPCAAYVAGAAGGGAEQWDGGEALLGVVLAARRLPPAHPARPAPAAARDLVRLAVDPPHYFSDDYGYRTWVDALWDAALSASSGDAAAALLCWRLRWLLAQLLLLPECEASAAEARRLRSSAQAALKRWGGAHAVAFAVFARVAHAAARRGGGGGGDAGQRAAAVALRHALQDDAVPAHYLLYIARIVDEVSDAPAGVLSAAGACALSCAALRRPLPADLLATADMLRAAREESERRCTAIEEELAASEEEEESCLGDGARLLRAMLPAAAEWGAARALLAAPPRRRRLLDCLLASGPGRGRTARWREQAAALTLRTRSGAAAARELSRRYPDNALLALVGSGAPLWATLPCAAACSTPAHALCGAWGALLRAAAAAWAPPAAGALARLLRRQCGGGGGGGAGAGAGTQSALAWALRLEAEARAPRPRLEYVAHAAMDALPAHKWLAVRSGALGAAGGGGALPDVLLERGARLHALPDELRALQAQSPAPAPAPAPDRHVPSDDEPML